MNGAKLLATYLKSLRNEAKFDLFYDTICHVCRNLTEEPSLPRHRKVPKRLDDGAPTHRYHNPRKDIAMRTFMKIKKVTNVRTIAEAMNKSTIYKGMLGEVDKLLKLYFTFPVTIATAERSFSSLRRIKTFLRSTYYDSL